MTQKEYKSECKSLDEQILALHERKNNLRSNFLKENAVFKEGDKVCVIWNQSKHPFTPGKVIVERRIEAFISSVHDKYFYGDVNYSFVKVKKDGTASTQSAGIYGGYDRIELIEQTLTPTI